MYTNTSRFRFNGKYGLFTIPKGILNEMGWKKDDLIGFWGMDDKVIYMEKIEVNESDEYDKKFYKKIAKVGGEGTFGIKSVPRFLMNEFNPKDQQEIYFLPGPYSMFKDYYPQNILKNILFFAFDPKNLELYSSGEKEENFDDESYFRDEMIKKHNLPVFTNSNNISPHHNKKSQNKFKRANEDHIGLRIKGQNDIIKKLKKWITQNKKSNHPQKEIIIEELNKRIDECKEEIQKLEKENPRLFRVFSKDEKKEFDTKQGKMKRKRIDKIKRRYERKNLSSK